jgi:hypothetical protein
MVDVLSTGTKETTFMANHLDSLTLAIGEMENLAIDLFQAHADCLNEQAIQGNGSDARRSLMRARQHRDHVEKIKRPDEIIEHLPYGPITNARQAIIASRNAIEIAEIDLADAKRHDDSREMAVKSALGILEALHTLLVEEGCSQRADLLDAAMRVLRNRHADAVRVA